MIAGREVGTQTRTYTRTHTHRNKRTPEKGKGGTPKRAERGTREVGGEDTGTHTHTGTTHTYTHTYIHREARNHEHVITRDIGRKERWQREGSFTDAEWETERKKRRSRDDRNRGSCRQPQPPAATRVRDELMGEMEGWEGNECRGGGRHRKGQHSGVGRGGGGWKSGSRDEAQGMRSPPPHRLTPAQTHTHTHIHIHIHIREDESL